MKIDQIAFGCANKAIWERHAADAEAVDEVVFSGTFFPKSDRPVKILRKVGFLAFDYKIGIEREYLFYPITADTFHFMLNFAGAQPLFLSHLASHVESIDVYLSQCGVGVRDTLVMDVLTESHTNEKIKDRKYRYVILDWRDTHGYFYKLIQRIQQVT